jgi:hypothetical protein
MLLYYLTYTASAVESLTEVVVSHAFRLLPVMVSLHQFRQPSDLGIGGMCNVAKQIIDLDHEIVVALGVQYPGSHLNSFL